MSKLKKPKHNLKRITGFMNEIDWAFELNNFDKAIVEVENQPEEYPNLTAEVIPDMIYREITIKLYPNFWELSLDLQRKALLHELVHTILQNTKMLAVDLIEGLSHSKNEIKTENEKTTSKITHLLDCLLKNHLRYAKRAYKDYLQE